MTRPDKDGGAQPSWNASFDFSYDPADANAPIVHKNVAKLAIAGIESSASASTAASKIVIVNARQVSATHIIATAYEASSSTEYEVLVDGKAECVVWARRELR